DWRELNHFLKRPRPHHLIDSLPKTLNGRRLQNFIGERGEAEMLVRVGERVVGDQCGDMAQLGGFRAQELAPRGRIEKKVANLDAPRASVERVFQELLDDRRRPLDNLARGDFVGNGFRKNANRGHRGSQRSRVESQRAKVKSRKLRVESQKSEAQAIFTNR